HAETVSALLGSALLFLSLVPGFGWRYATKIAEAVSLESFEESEFTQYTHFIGALLLRGHDRRQVTEYFGYDPLLAGQN
ncbi:hypothetical protein RJZ57_008416, partial [Blastomyces gilchristii]